MAHDANTANGLRGAIGARTAIGDFCRLIAGQTALLFSGFAIAQGCSFLRNVIVANTLARGDFGIAAIILLTMQLIETLTDLGSDKLIVQADDGASRAVVGTAQTFQMLRGIATAALVIATAYPLASFYRVPDAAPAFMLVALAPLMRGFLNLDMRRAQRDLDNRPFIAVEAIPQILALAITPLALWLAPTFEAVVVIAVVQAGAAVLVSHLTADQRIAPCWDRDVARRMLAFSWPIWLSALPLIAVYQGDRILIGRFLGMEAVAGYSAAFMITMVPGLIAAKVGHALLLPLLADVKHDATALRFRMVLMTKAVGAVALVYLMVFALAGGPVLALTFGAAYADLGGLVAVLAAMWALRMVQAVPGMALMAVGSTRPLLMCGIVRACGLVPAYFVVTSGGGLIAVAAVGLIAEALSFALAVFMAMVMTQKRVRVAAGA